jgi:hypothetical protein
MNIYKNFLPKKTFAEVKKNMMSNYFPWYFNDWIINNKDKNFQFTFTFMNDNNKQLCADYIFKYIEPVLKKIKYNKLNRVKANLLTKTKTIVEHGFHTDQPQGITGIFYINNCNGYTKFKNGKKIKSEENKYIEFDSTLQHTGSSCTDEKRRVVINFNYQ